jgi:hypothetical protein
MRRLLLAFPIGLSVLALGCTPVKWAKSGATQADYQRDKRECTQVATGFAEDKKFPSTEPTDYAYIGDRDTYLSNQGMVYRYFNKCMEDRGYTRVK